MTVREQERGAKIARTREELDAYLVAERTCRVATVSPLGPQNRARWFVWDGTALWLTSLVKSQRWTDLEREPRVAVLVDAGEAYGELRGAELRGKVEVVGEVPRTGEANPELDVPEVLMARKYYGTDTPYYDGRHAWLKLIPEKITSWDFRKLAAL